MFKEKIITKERGLKAEDCAVIAQIAGKFNCSIFIIKDNKKVNAKSVMGIISLNIKMGDTIYLNTVGEDDDNAQAAIYSLL